MEQKEQIALIERATRHIHDKTSDRAESYRVSAEFYNSPAQLKREREVLFTRYPLVAGSSSQVKHPGDYFLFEFADQSILVVRGENGQLYAHANFCRHRGTKLVETPAGTSHRFVCPYHAWSYATDGHLISAPHRDNFEIDARCNLKSFPVAEKYGLVWVKPTVGATLNLEVELGPLARDLESFGFDTHVAYAPKNFVSPINWKLMIEASLETYHFKYTHARTIAPMFFDDLGVFDWQSPHGRMFLPKQSIKDTSAQDPAQWNIRVNGNLIYFFFPNTVLLVQPDHATWMSSYPINERESRIQGGTLIPSLPDNEKSQKHWDKNVEIFWQAIYEDYTMSEKIQKGLNSGHVDEVLFGKTEYLVHHYHQEITKALNP